MIKTTKMALLAVSMVGALFSAQVTANPSQIYVFGDSLSDNGNAGGRASNGLVAVEYLAGGLGLTLTPSRYFEGSEQGNNYAVGGARAVDADGDESTIDTNLPSQVNSFLAFNGGIADPDNLYVVIIGGNDLLAAQDIRSQAIFAQTNEEAEAARQATKDYIDLAVDTTIAQVEKLINAGATNILVANTPDIGSVPLTDIKVAGYLGAAQTTAQVRKSERFYKVSTRLSTLFNRKLSRGIFKLERNYDLDIPEYDLFDFLATQISDADEFGNTNVEEGCVSPVTGINPACDFPTATGFVFWDVVHLTTVVHQRAAVEMLELLAE